MHDIFWSQPAEIKAARLREAANFVAQIPDAQFNMEHWYLPDGMAFDDDRNRMYRVADGKCGCAIGNMCMAGLYGLHTDDLIQKYPDRIFVIIGDVFGIPFKLAEFAFGQYGYIGRPIKQCQVAARLRYIADELLGFVS